MIFYFTGTGNSFQAASALLEENEELYNITECVQEKRFQFSPGEGEKAGIVCPVYYGGLPSIVQVFLSHLQFTEAPFYVYGVITCGGGIYGAGDMMAGRLKKSGINLDAVFSVKMPENYVIMFEVPSEEQQAEILGKAEEALALVKEKIRNCRKEGLPAGPGKKAASTLMYPFYVHGRKTDKFYTIDTCVSCGICAQRCPEKAIRLVDGVPTWVKDRCVQCMACLRCGAIQYGKKTEGRKRYVNPAFKKKKSCH